jgi:hypothetical protein
MRMNISRELEDLKVENLLDIIGGETQQTHNLLHSKSILKNEEESVTK